MDDDRPAMVARILDRDPDLGYSLREAAKRFLQTYDARVTPPRRASTTDAPWGEEGTPMADAEQLFAALREAEQQLSDRREDIEAAQHALEARQAELVMATTLRDEALAYNTVLRQQRDTMDGEVAQLRAFAASLQSETTVLMEMCEAAEGQLTLLITEKLALMKSLRAELLAALA